MTRVVDKILDRLRREAEERRRRLMIELYSDPGKRNYAVATVITKLMPLIQAEAGLRGIRRQLAMQILFNELTDDDKFYIAKLIVERATSKIIEFCARKLRQGYEKWLRQQRGVTT